MRQVYDGKFAMRGSEDVIPVPACRILQKLRSIGN
jgi:hypothetical protein